MFICIQKIKLTNNFFFWDIVKILMMMMNYFWGMVDWRKGLSLISSRDYCQRSWTLGISDMPRAGSEPVQNLSSGFVEWSCVVVIPLRILDHPHQKSKFQFVICAPPNTPKMIVWILKNLWCSCAGEKSTSYFTFSLRYCKVIANLLFWDFGHAWLCTPKRILSTCRKLWLANSILALNSLANFARYGIGGEIWITILVSILDFQEQLITKVFKKSKKPYFGVIWGFQSLSEKLFWMVAPDGISAEKIILKVGSKVTYITSVDVILMSICIFSCT